MLRCGGARGHGRTNLAGAFRLYCSGVWKVLLYQVVELSSNYNFVMIDFSAPKEPVEAEATAIDENARVSALKLG